MTDHLHPAVLAQWLAGELSPEERRAVDDWLAADPARRTELDRLRELWDRAGVAAEQRRAAAGDLVLEQARWTAIRRAIRDGAADAAPIRTIKFPLSQAPGRRRRSLVAAAAVIALAMSGGTVWQIAQHAPPPANAFVAPAGMPTTVLLSDGSRATLAPGSRLTFTERGWPRTIRSATLEGQALFAVAHDARHPFVVTAGSIATRVLGTEFNVRAYPHDPSPSVAVRSGRVQVTATRPDVVGRVIVTPGRAARIDSLGRIRVDAADLEHTLAWTVGRLEFVGAEVPSVLDDVNRWYGLRLRLADTALGHQHITVVFDRVPGDTVVATLRRLLGPDALSSLPLSGSRP